MMTNPVYVHVIGFGDSAKFVEQFIWTGLPTTATVFWGLSTRPGLTSRTNSVWINIKVNAAVRKDDIVNF
jgi:hypothetical protein